MKGMQEKEPLMGLRCGQKNPSQVWIFLLTCYIIYCVVSTSDAIVRLVLGNGSTEVPVALHI